ncbi:MAG TPA: RsmE family RNA methyltransferase [Kofleriaceae bacterium]|nr:RsmE family RNA methyltransferase [Kofleriaceae bacterium]
MNLLLLEPGEAAAAPVRVGGRRAEHLRRVLKVAIGDQIRAGVIGGPVGAATIVGDDGVEVELALALDGMAPAPMPIDLVLAIPRPKVLSRVLETAAAFAVRRIDLVNAWRVDKAYLDSPRLAAAAIDEHLRLGAEQGMTTHLPAATVHRRLMPFLDEHHPAGAMSRGARLCAHARGGVPIEEAWRGGDTRGQPLTLAIGPEGGWIEREVETFAARGFAIVTLADAVLRVEAAVAAALGQLALLLRRGDPARRG